MKCYVKNSPQHGKGVFACQAIVAGECVMVFSGALLHQAQVDFNDYHLQVGDDVYIGPSGGADDYVNHSCDPNCGFKNGLELVALRDIAAEEELTWDYSTAIDEEGFPGFPCSCGSVNCRGMVKSFRDLPADVQVRLRPWLLPYLQTKYFSAG
jgi:SET domain-containing protein